MNRIHKLLHWWIGLKACNVILARERLDRERRKKAENRQARAEAEFGGQNESGTPASFVALAPNSVLHEADTASRGSPMSSTAMLTPPESGESPVVGPREGFAFAAFNGHGTASNAGSRQEEGHQTQNTNGGVWNRHTAEASNPNDGGAPNGHPSQVLDGKLTVQQHIANANQATIDRQISVGVAQLVASFRSEDASTEDVPQPNNSIPYHGLDPDCLRALRQYIYGEEHGIEVNEDALLDRLELTWRENVRGDYHKMVENIPAFIARERAILTWFELKRHLAALERADQRTYSILSLQS